MDHLIEKLQRLQEEAAAAPSASPPGTTEDDITYVPAHVGVVRKPRVQEEEGGMEPEKDLKNLQVKLKGYLESFFRHGDLGRAKSLYEAWHRFWGNGKTLDREKENVAVSFEHQDRDIQRLYADLIAEYGEDRGSLEIMIEDLKEGKTPSMFEGFKEYEFLYGSRVLSNHQGIDVLLEFYLDPAENIYLTVEVLDEEVSDKLEEISKSSRRVGNVFYPNSASILQFIQNVKQAINDVIDDQDAEREEDAQTDRE